MYVQEGHTMLSHSWREQHVLTAFLSFTQAILKNGWTHFPHVYLASHCNLLFSAVAKPKKESYYHAKNVILIKYEGTSQHKHDWLGIQRKSVGRIILLSCLSRLLNARIQSELLNECNKSQRKAKQIFAIVQRMLDNKSRAKICHIRCHISAP